LKIRQNQLESLKAKNKSALLANEQQGLLAGLLKRIDKKDYLLSSISLILEDCHKKPILAASVHGLLIDMLEFPLSFSYVLEVAGGKKLFSIIVDNENTAEKVVGLNIANKGVSINIFPVTWLKQMKVPSLPIYPESPDIVTIGILLILTIAQRIKSR